MQENSFYPPIRTLMGPGPTDVHPKVLQALAMPTIGHLDPQFVTLMDEIKGLLKYAFKTENELTLPISGPGSLGMEACFVNLVEEGDKVIVCQNGVFGTRMADIVRRLKAVPIIVEDPWGRAIDPNKLEAALKKNPDVKFVAMVHAETSTGALSDVKTLTEIAHKYDCLTIVDAVTSLGGSKLLVDEWKLDVVYSGTQKCLSAPPGLSPVTFNQRAVDLIKKRKNITSWFMDMNLVLGYWGEGAKRSYHHTAPVNSLYGLHESLVLLKNEGLENSWKRHERLNSILEKGLKAFGLEYLVPKNERILHMNVVSVPEGQDEAKIRSDLLNNFNLEIGGGLGPLAGKYWRIGLMGYSCRMQNINQVFGALGRFCLNGVNTNFRPEFYLPSQQI
ncbi:MAG: alanine--glyoxylate aminotransferase family protein [Deltaproteobacteria bacterium]|nr:MAG: alanine--glyoxylate aminotransferase family protein [Deltaproteobacteria bacterium]